MSPTAVAPLTIAEIELPLDPAWFPFATTAEVEPLVGLAAQPRAVRALELGLGIGGSGYNVFVVGLSGAHLSRLLQTFVAERLTSRAVPRDWVFVNNFDEPDRPLALSLPAGAAVQLRRDMRELPGKLAQMLPRAMQYQGFNQEKERLQRDCNERCNLLFEQLRALCSGREMHVEVNQEGNLVFAPLRELQPMTQEEMGQMTPDEIAVFFDKQMDVLREAQPIFEQQQAVLAEMQQAVHNIERTFADALLTSLFDPLWTTYNQEPVRRWLERVHQHILDNLASFFNAAANPQPQAEEGLPSPVPAGLDYDVNVVVDNSGRTAPPVHIEEAPSYKNLFGFVERTIGLNGQLLTHFTQIKTGSLLRANGGVLIFHLDDAIEEPQMWKELKRTLKSGRVQIDSYDTNIPLGASALKPEAIPLDVKLIVVGSRNLFYFLSCMDPDFSALFKIKAEFADKVPLDAEGCRLYAQLARRLAQHENLLPFDAGAVRELVRFGARTVADRRRLSVDFSHVANLMREANHNARQAGLAVVEAGQVRKALEERTYRSNWFAEQTLGMMKEGTLLLRTTGHAVGEINSLVVLSLGDFEFGQPVRLTASAWVGQTGVINVERESRLSGSTHDKGMLIMEGYLRGKYAGDAPIGLGASLAFEQSYGGIDGDSASAAELFCLVSALSGLPLRQDIGVTGSVNQHGMIQVIGGVNEKIEGFFDVCRAQGLSGTQGVCFPQANVPNLILRPDVVEAVRQGRFHLWPLETLDEGLTLLTGLPAGDVTQPDSVHGRVAARFQQIGQAMRDTPPSPLERNAPVPSTAPPLPPAPPSLPPHG